MNSMPISSNKPQPSGNAANTLLANIAADHLAMDAQPAEPFAFLLARQIGETDLAALNTAQTAVAIDGNATDGSTNQPLKDAQDQAVDTANTTGDPANALAAILLQLPVHEDMTQKIEGQQTMQPLTLSHFQGVEDRQPAQPLALNPSQKTDGQQATQPLPLNPFQKTEDRQPAQPLPLTPFQKTDSQQATQPFALSPPQETGYTGYKGPMAGSEYSPTTRVPATDHLPLETTKRVELLSGPTQPTLNTAQAIASPAISAAIPGMLTNNMPVSTPPTIATPLGNNGWADEFSQKITWISTQQNQVAELHLNPPNLGPLDVVLKISDNQATALFASPHGAVRDAVENALPKLREILADNGIMLGNTTISDQPPRDRSMDGFMNQGFGTAVQQEVSGIAPESAGSSPATAQTVPARRHNGMVDTFA